MRWIGPHLGATFTISANLPLAFFLLMLGATCGSAGGWLAVAAVALPLIREDHRRFCWWERPLDGVRDSIPSGLAMALGGLGIGWVLLVDQPV